MTEEKKVVKSQWPAVINNIANGVGGLLLVLIVVIAFNYKGMLEAWNKHVQPVQCEIADKPSVKELVAKYNSLPEK